MSHIDFYGKSMRRNRERSFSACQEANKRGPRLVLGRVLVGRLGWQVAIRSLTRIHQPGVPQPPKDAPQVFGAGFSLDRLQAAANACFTFSLISD